MRKDSRSIRHTTRPHRHNRKKHDPSQMTPKLSFIINSCNISFSLPFRKIAVTQQLSWSGNKPAEQEQVKQMWTCLTDYISKQGKKFFPNYPDLDVLIEFYTQRCTPCHALLPTYEKLARLYASHTTPKNQVTIAKIDAEANGIPDRDARGFPTFILYPASSKESLALYFGPWKLEDWAKFIRHNGTHRPEVDLGGGAMGDELSKSKKAMKTA